jgi:hypothetical protein
LINFGLARQQDFDFLIQELKKSERSFGPVFRRENPDWRRSPESVVHAKDMAIRLQNSSWVISGLGVIAGLILMFVSSQNFSGDATHPFLGSGLVLIASSIFFGFCVHAVGAFMEARLEQGESRLE